MEHSGEQTIGIFGAQKQWIRIECEAVLLPH